MRCFTLMMAVVGLLAVTAGALQLRGKPEKQQGPTTKTQVAEMIAKLEKVSTGLDAMVDQKAMEKVKPSLQAFATELHHTLDEVKADKEMSDDKKAALLRNAQQGLVKLQKKLAEEQQNLLKEDAAQKESVLMGVLMTRQNRPQKEQWEVLEADDFKDLPVAKALLAKRDESTPLFKQVAIFLDGEEKSSGKAAAPPAAEEKPAAAAAPKVEKPKNKAEAKAALLKVTTLLEHNLAHLKATLKEEEQLHKEHMAKLDAGFQRVLTEKTELNATTLTNLQKGKKAADAAKAVEGAKKKALETMEHLKVVFRALKKKETRQYEKWHVHTARDVHNLENSISGLKSGDLKAVEKARSALVESMQAMQAQSGDFLHLLQTSESTSRRAEDCPYCAAQCLEKCHNSGASYVQCMTVTCKDAGKGF